MIEVIIILILFVLNGFFAMCEIALVSSKKALLKQKAKNGSKGAQTALKLLEEPAKFLSTVQIGITLIGIIAGAFGGEAFTSHLQPYVEKITLLKPYAQQISFGFIVAVITFFSLVIGELVPKTIALNNPEGITIALAPLMRGLAIITYPFVLFLSFSTKLILKMLFIKERKDPPVTEDELKYMIDTGLLHGAIEKRESDIIHRVFKSEDKKASEVMTPRKAVIWIDINQTKEQIQQQVFQAGVSKIPVCNGRFDKLLGVATINSILAFTTGLEPNLQDLLTAPVFFTEHMTVLRILEDFRKNKTHIGFVVNEHGTIKGLITLQDIIENIVGEIPELEDDMEDDIIIRPDGTFLIDSGVTINKLKNNIEGLDNLKETMTVSEFVKYQLQAEPKTGLSIKYGNYTYEIIDMDGLKIDKILIYKR